MTYNEDIKRLIKDAQRNFADHVATWYKVPLHDIEVLDWSKPGSIAYSMRVVFDNERGRSMYICGDIGEAVVYPTCPSTLADVAKCFTSRKKDGGIDVNESYFLEKVRATSDRWTWGREEFVEDFKKKIAPCLEYGTCGDFDVDVFLEERLGYVNGHFSFYGEDGLHIDSENGVSFDSGVEDELRKVDVDFREWIYNCGKRLHPRIVMWLVGLRLAWEQLEVRRTWSS